MQVHEWHQLSSYCSLHMPRIPCLKSAYVKAHNPHLAVLEFYFGVRILPPFSLVPPFGWRLNITIAGGSLSGNAALYNEVITLFGTYHPGNWGCNTTGDRATVRPPRLYGASENAFIRFHFTGSLEMSLMALDLYDVTARCSGLESLLTWEYHLNRMSANGLKRACVCS
jgi:hypothetical protein